MIALMSASPRKYFEAPGRSVRYGFGVGELDCGLVPDVTGKVIVEPGSDFVRRQVLCGAGDLPGFGDQFQKRSADVHEDRLAE